MIKNTIKPRKNNTLTMPDPKKIIHLKNGNGMSFHLEIIKEKILNKFGEYSKVISGENAKNIHYLKELTKINGKVIRFGSNLIDLKQFSRGKDIITCLIPLGSKQDEECIDLILDTLVLDHTLVCNTMQMSVIDTLSLQISGIKL